jgi:non-haem Fe2+, alpha-ketoglutarate-dependent halogenase
MTRRLSKSQQQFYSKNGYLTGLPPVYDEAGVKSLNDGMAALYKLLKPGETPIEIREWHEGSRFLFDICMHPRILDYVEDILGPDFYLWASSFFTKDPHTPDIVAWHQDAYYWPLNPPESCTVWLAFSDSDRENGAMRVLPGSHKAGLIRHQKSDDTDSVLTLECDTGNYSENEQVFLQLKAGELSLHDDKIIHGSEGNNSDRPRIGFTIRYSRTNVKCDLNVNPFFRTYHCRGVDEYEHNPRFEAPIDYYGRIDKEYRNVETDSEVV